MPSPNEDLYIRPYDSLRRSGFRLFIFYRFSNTIGLAMLDVIVGWHVYQITKDPLALGLIGLAEAIPFITASLLAGYVADTFDRRRIMLLCSGMLVGAVGVLVLLSATGYLEHSGTGPIYLMMGVIGVTKGFLSPSSSAYMMQLLPIELYADGANINSNTWQLAAVTGPVIGGFTFGFLGASFSYVIVGAFMLCGCVFVFFSHPVAPQRREPHESMIQALTLGFRFVWDNQVILSTISLDLFAVLFGGAVAVLPMFVSEVLHAGPATLGILRASPSVGSVLTGFYLVHHPPVRRTGKKLLLAVAGFGFTTVLFALTSSIQLAALFLFLAGAFDCVSVVIRATIIPTITPDYIRGRVSAINNIFITSSNEIGAFESGLAAKLISLIPSIVFGGVMTLIVVGTTALAAPKLKQLELRRPPD